ncbi:MAG TPA: VWA domain-containing protein, partial [Polyangiaceae bacterium]|nr:VWA domain-containing protein [Polyangiaceae bacterium]
ASSHGATAGDASVGDAKPATGGTGGVGGSGGDGGAGASTGSTGGAGGFEWPEGGSSGSSATGGSGGTGFDAGPDVDFSYDAPPTPDGFNPDATCAETIVEAQLTPLDMYIMMDKSSSMEGARWNNVVAAVKGFVDDSASAGIGVGLQYFPVLPSGYTSTCSSDGQCGNYGPCWNTYCRACATTHYSTPAVGITTLPGGAGAIKSSLNATSPFGGTPTGPALTGAIQYATNWANTHPGHTVVVVLATDGDPYSCTPSTIPEISNVAAAGKNQTPSVLTFVIGVGTSLANMNAIAAAGGTQKAYLVDTGGNVTQQFIQALNDIREKSLGCEYVMPTTDAGVIDPALVQLTFTPGGGTPRNVPQVDDASQCAGEGWYYNDKNNPTRLILCPSFCSTVQADKNGKIEISLGCLSS